MPSICFDLLRLLADANFRSGRVLARELGATPAAVRLALAELEQLGLALARERGRGYRLRQAYDFLDAGAVHAQLGPQAAGFKLELLDECASTNTLLLERARANAPSSESASFQKPRSAEKLAQMKISLTGV